MGINVQIPNLKHLLRKYAAPALILLVGIFLMLLPKTDAQDHQEVITEQPDNIMTIEQQLSCILSTVEGAGQVHVMLTVAFGQEMVYQTDINNSIGIDSTTTRYETITVTDNQRTQTGLIRQINPPIYKGAIVVCEGAGNPAVRLAIVEAVSKITGLGADKISVLKMK